MNQTNKIKLLIFSFAAIACSTAYSETPDGFYDNAIGKNGASLKTALHSIIRTHTFLDYDAPTSIWWYTYFKQTDWNTDGYFIDMYSDYKRASYNSSQMNREHCMPRSWWGNSDNYSAYDANGDLTNLSPSDAEANEAKSNYSLGVVGSTTTYTNGVVKVGKGANSLGYNDLVFEPADEYKGDFARTYMYMVTCYEDYSSYWHGTGTASMLINNTYPVFKTWAINLLLKWNAQDPVSEKETKRNDAVYSIQHNRNPFIDHPELAEYIWGKYSSVNWDGTNETPAYGEELHAWFNKTGNIIGTNLTSLGSTGNAYYKLYYVSGVLVKEGSPAADGSIEVPDIENGCYLISVYTNKTRLVTKIIINK